MRNSYLGREINLVRARSSHTTEKEISLRTKDLRVKHGNPGEDREKPIEGGETPKRHNT